MIYDLRLNNKFKIDKFVFDKEVRGHIDPVWQIKWQKDTIENYRSFFSLSSDGHVINWVLKKNKIFSHVVVRLEHVDLDTTLFDNEPLSKMCF